MNDPEAAATPRPLRLLVVDDHEVVRQGLVALLERRPGFEIVAEAGTAAQAVAEAARFEPDVVVMDVRLPDGDVLLDAAPRAAAGRGSAGRRHHFAAFLPRPTVFFGPLRVRAFVFVRWPRTGSPRRWRMPR